MHFEAARDSKKDEKCDFNSFSTPVLIQHLLL